MHPLNILLLCNKPITGKVANTVIDHIESIEKYSTHTIFTCSMMVDFPIKLDLSKFDVVVVHYSLSLLTNYYISKKSKQLLRNFSGLKVIFIQDEYRQINNMINELLFLKTDVLFTCFPEPEISKVYPENKLPGVSIFNNLTGYIPEHFFVINNQPKMKERSLHLGYRGRTLPFWYGELGFEKSNIVDQWKKCVTDEDIFADISYNERDRIYGDNWIKFLSSCKATLGVESGASVMDFTGELEKTIDHYQLSNPNVNFYSIQQQFLMEYEGKYKLNQISPRIFEAVALKTAMVLFEGEYSGILEPGRHYIPLKKNFSNIQDVLTCLRDDDFLQQMVDTTYQEVALNPQNSYKCFVERVDQIIQNEFVHRAKQKANKYYQSEQFNCDIHNVSFKTKFYKTSLPIYQRLPFGIRLMIKESFRPSSIVKYSLKNCMILLGAMKKKFIRGEVE